MGRSGGSGNMPLSVSVSPQQGDYSQREYLSRYRSDEEHICHRQCQSSDVLVTDQVQGGNITAGRR